VASSRLPLAGSGGSGRSGPAAGFVGAGRPRDGGGTASRSGGASAGSRACAAVAAVSLWDDDRVGRRLRWPL
jgi:hypothetical protein